MAYSDQDDLRNLELTNEEMVELTDDPNLGEVFAAQLAEAIERGDAEIDKYCAGYYVVPFNPTPTLVKGWSATLAAFYLFRNREKPDTLVDRYNKVMKDLSRISEGELKLPNIAEDPDAAGIPASTTDGCGHEFTRDLFNSDGTRKSRGSMTPW